MIIGSYSLIWKLPIRLHLNLSVTERNRVCESEDSVEITFQILTIKNVILRDGLVTVVHI